MHERRFNPEHLEKLDNPQRRALFDPQPLLSELDVKGAKSVLDIGAGSGYFTIPAAKMTEGTVYALDVEPKMLQIIKAKAEEEKLTNITYLQGAMENVPLAGGTAERVIASLVLHEAETLDQGVAEIKRVMTAGGLCFILEWEKKESEQGPPLHHRISSEDMKKALEQHGLRIRRMHFPTDSHYSILCEK